MDLRQHFRELHAKPFVIPNPWDRGSARIFASLGFKALATTSGGFAATSVANRVAFSGDSPWRTEPPLAAWSHCGPKGTVELGRRENLAISHGR